jgi:hypothetical protein
MKLNGLRQLVKEELRRALDKNDIFKSLKVGETVKYMGEDHKVVGKNEAVITLERNKTGKKFNLNSSQVNEKVRRAEDFNEIKINNPNSWQDPQLVSLAKARIGLKNKTGKDSSLLDLKIGKYNLSGTEQGVELSWEEGSSLLSSTTKTNIAKVFNDILGINPTKIYIGVVPNSNDPHKTQKSIYIYGEYNNIPVVIARKSTPSPSAGQTFLVSPTRKDKLSNYSAPYGGISLEILKQNIINDFNLENTNEIKITKPESPQSRYHRYVMELPRVIQDLEPGETYEVSYKFKDNYGDIGRDKIEISITPEQQREYYNKSIGFYINDLIDLTGDKVVTIDNVKKVLDEIKITKPGNFNSFIESYTNYLKNISREEMFDKSGNYNSTLKGYHDTLKQYTKSGTEEEQLKANFLLGFM